MNESQKKEAGHRLKEWISSKDGLTVVSFARVLGVNDSTLYKIWNYGQLSVDTQAKVYLITELDEFEPSDEQSDVLEQYFFYSDNLKEEVPTMYDYMENGIIPPKINKKKKSKSSKAKVNPKQETPPILEVNLLTKDHLPEANRLPPPEVPQSKENFSQFEHREAGQIESLRVINDLTSHMLGQDYVPNIETLQESINQSSELTESQQKLGEFHCSKAIEFIQQLLSSSDREAFVTAHRELLDHLGNLTAIITAKNPKLQIDMLTSLNRRSK